MKASYLLYAKSSVQGVVVIEGQSSSHRIRIVGSSVAKFTANEDYSNSVALSIKKGDRGFVAVNVLTHNGKNTEEFVFFLKIGWGEDGEHPLIDFDSQWVPESPERLGIIKHYGIRVEIGGLIFTSNQYDNKYDKTPGIRYVSDHNLICRYLAGDIEADVVEKAAAEYVEEESAMAKLPELEKKIQELTTLLIEKENLLAKEKKAAEKYCQQEMVVYERWRAASEVIGEVEKQWFHRPSIKEALQKYNAHILR